MFHCEPPLSREFFFFFFDKKKKSSLRPSPKNVRPCTFLNDGIRAAGENPQRIRTDTDVREIKQQRVCPANSTLNSVHGRTLFNSAMDGGGSKQKQVCSCKLVAQECARTHILGRGWRWFYPESSLHCELVAISARRYPYQIAYTVRNVEPYAQTVPGLLLGTVRQKLSSMEMKNADLTFSAKTL